jgi:hypothetical protein
MSSKTVEISRAKFHEIQKTNNAHDVTMTSNTYPFCWKQVLTSKVWCRLWNKIHQIVIKLQFVYIETRRKTQCMQSGVNAIKRTYMAPYLMNHYLSKYLITIWCILFHRRHHTFDVKTCFQQNGYVFDVIVTSWALFVFCISWNLKLFTDEFHYLKWIIQCTEIVFIYIMVSYIQSEEGTYWV